MKGDVPLNVNSPKCGGALSEQLVLAGSVLGSSVESLEVGTIGEEGGVAI